MWGNEDCSLSHTKASDSLDLGRHPGMFRPSYRSSSPFSLTDLDMWDSKSRFTAQTAAWSGMASVSGTGFMSKVSTSTSGSSGGFRQSDPGLRKWQSLSHLAPEGATRSFPPSPGAELRAARGQRSFRHAEVGQWLQDAREHLDTQLERLTTRNSQLSHSITSAQMLDMKHKQLSEAINALEQEKEAAELSQSEKSRQRGELREKVLQLEKDLLQMKSTLDKGQPTAGTTKSQEGLNRQERQKVDTELCKLREALRDAETRAKTREEELNQALQKLHTSTETQRTLLNQIEEMNQRLNHTRQNHSEVQEQLSEANNKISQACLEKAILSTKVLKLEDNIKELKDKQTGPQSDKGHLTQKADLHQKDHILEPQQPRIRQGSEVCDVLVIQADNNKQDRETLLMKDELKAVREAKENLTCELETITEKLKASQCQLEEIAAERVISSKQISDLEAERSQLIREKEELLSEIKEGREDELKEMKEKCCQLRESVEVLEVEKLNLQDQCLILEAKVLEKDEKLQVQEEEYQKQDAMKIKNTEELTAMVSHWTEKWQKVALTLRSTEEELEQLKKNKRNELQVDAAHLARETEKLRKESQKDKEEIKNLLQHKANTETALTKAKETDSLLRAELDACKQELRLERSRNQTLLHRYKAKGGEAAQTQDKETVTELSESSLLWEPPSDSQTSQNKSPQVCTEVQRLKQKLAEREKQLSEKEEALRSLERLREAEINQAQLKISALELKGQDDGGKVNVSSPDSLRAQLEESRRRANQLQQEKTLAVQKLQTLRQIYPVKDEKPSVEGKKDKTVCPADLETGLQRRMVAEQLKNLFKEREGKEVGKADNRSSAAQSGASSLQDWSQSSKAASNATDRRSWQYGSGLMPVFEEDEESCDCPGGEQEIIHDQNKQMSTVSAGICSLRAKNDNRLQATLTCKLPIQDCPPAAEKPSDKTSDVDSPKLTDCSQEIDLQRTRPPSIYPDGIFQAELVNICSPDEDEDDK